ncbi:MAG: putative glutamine-dependent synthetase [Pseudomonadota bacterium]
MATINQGMKLAIAQMNFVVGDIAGNSNKILSAAEQAKKNGATLLLTPELSLTGYPPEDLLLRADFNAASQAALLQLAQKIDGITVIVGHPHAYQGNCYNAASVLQDGKVIATYHKHALPNHSVFDELRYFSAGTEPLIFEHQGVKCGVLICADVWDSPPAILAKKAGAEVLLVLNASPYHLEKQDSRHQIARDRVAQTGLALVYCNLVGGQDELVFDGGSFVLDRSGELVQQLPAFEEALALVELDLSPRNYANVLPADIAPSLPIEAAVYRALCLGLKDYVAKNNFKGVVLGLSGGIDSALTLAIAVDALGAEQVRVVMMPSEFTAEISVSDAHLMAEMLGVRYSELPISALFNQFRETLADEFAGLPFDATEENLQARIRGMLLMALSNKFGSIVLTTGNKSEMAVGYSTLYGDMAGGFALLKDVPKTLVYKLAHYRNSLGVVIPERIITRAPSAELRHDQKDQDSLPPYEILDAIMEAYVEDDASRADIIAQGYSKQDVERVTTLIDRNEYKRRQSPIGVRITHRGFGKDRRYPITSKFAFNG